MTRVSYHSSSSPSPFILVIVIAIIIVVIIITIIIFLVYYLLVSSLLPSFMPRCRLVFYPCASAVSFFEAKLVLQYLRSVILPGQLFLDTLLDTSEPCLGTCSWEPILRNPLLGALPGNLFLGTLSWEPVLGNFACLLQTCSLGPCSGTCFS